MSSDDVQIVFLRRLEEHRGILFKVTSAYCRREPDREDLIQSIVAELWRAYPRFDPSRTFSTWMYRVAMNVAISHYRSQARHKDVLTGAELFENIPAPSGTDADEPYEILQSLGEFDRALLLLHLDGYPYAEIAGMLGISETNVATKLSRIKQRLRRESAAGSA